MASNKRYQISYNGRSIEISRANSSTLVYRVPYQNIKDKDEPFPFALKNPFIVYILFGKNDSGKDVIYVGKSKNGIAYRPTAHDDKYDKWTYCYILTQVFERSYFNDGSIQYIEDKLNNKFNSLGTFINTTKTTTSGTANLNDETDCDEYLEEVYQMLDVLGFDLITHHDDDPQVDDSFNDEDESIDDFSLIPNGIYNLSRKIKRENNKIFTAKLKVADGTFILLKGSKICPSEGAGLRTSIINKRSEANIADGVLQEDIVCSSPSYAASFVIGGSCNGWEYWTTDEGKTINRFKP